MELTFSWLRWILTQLPHNIKNYLITTVVVKMLACVDNSKWTSSYIRVTTPFGIFKFPTITDVPMQVINSYNGAVHTISFEDVQVVWKVLLYKKS